MSNTWKQTKVTVNKGRLTRKYVVHNQVSIICWELGIITYSDTNFGWATIIDINLANGNMTETT